MKKVGVRVNAFSVSVPIMVLSQDFHRFLGKQIYIEMYNSVIDTFQKRCLTQNIFLRTLALMITVKS